MKSVLRIRGSGWGKIRVDGSPYRKEAVGEVHDPQGMVVAGASGAGVHLVRRAQLLQVPTQGYQLLIGSY